MKYNEDDELESKINSLLKKYKLNYRFITIEDDKVVIGVEGTKTSCCPLLIKKFKQLKLQPINIVYGKWVFKSNL